MSRGKFIVVEGGDGAGKGTQSRMAVDRLRGLGIDVLDLSFPRYKTPPSALVEHYLNKDFGPFETVHPYTSTLFYCADQALAAPQIAAHLEKGGWVWSDRLYESSDVYQGLKFRDPADKAKFRVWLKDLMHDRVGLPHPDLTIVIGAPVAARDANVGKKTDRTWLKDAKDAHEADLPFQARVELAYRELASLPNHVLVDCEAPDGSLHPAPICHDLVWKEIEKAFAFTPALP